MNRIAITVINLTLVLFSSIALLYWQRQKHAPAVSIQAPPQHSQLASPTEAQRLSPTTAIWLIQRIAITTNAGIIGILPGTQVKLVEDHGEKVLVSDGNQTFEATREQITTDVAVAQSASANDFAGQSAVANNIARSISQHKQAVAAANAQQKTTKKMTRKVFYPSAVSSMQSIGGNSSARFKQNIEPMNNASEAILALKPVTFRYKQDLDPAGIPQFGLVAEEVEKVNPDLVARDSDGKVYTVRYDAVNAMLLNEFLKEHRMVKEQQKEIDTVKSELKEQKAQIKKVSAQVEASKPAPQVVNNSQ